MARERDLVAAALAAVGVDYGPEEIEAMYRTDPAMAERMLDAYEQAMDQLRQELQRGEADVDAARRLAERAKAAGKTPIELLPEFAAAEGWEVHGNPRRKLTVTTPNGGTMTYAPLVQPAPQPRNREARARSPRRQKTRSTSAASRDGPEPDEDPLAPSPARAGLEVVA